MMIASSGRITTQALISTAAPAFCASAPGKLNPTERPPPIATDCFRNFRRAGSNLRANLVFMAAPYVFVDFKVFAAAWIVVWVRALVPKRKVLVIAASMSLSVGWRIFAMHETAA